MALLAAIDVALRVLGLLPPDDPILFHARSHERAFSPFVEDRQGQISIRRDQVNPGDGLRGVAGRRAGRKFLYPGFRPARFAREKPVGALRVFTLGGSTAFGVYVGPERSFSAVLEKRLRALAPDRSVEVINLGCAGWASDRVVNLLGTVLALDPDLLIVYSGHNEMLVGDIGAGADLPPATRLRATLLRVSSLFAWLNHVVATTLRARGTEVLREEALAFEKGHALTWDPWEAPPADRRPPAAGFMRRAADAYARNLHAMISAAEAGGVPIVLAMPVSNLLYPPVTGDERADPDRFQAAMEAGAAALAAGRPRQAVARFEEALSLSPDHGRAHHELGLAWIALHEPKRALTQLVRARDLDLRTHRMTSRLQDTLVSVAKERGVPWVDLRPAFRTPLDIPTSRLLFHDHLHPTATGHERIADELLPDAARLLGIPAPGYGGTGRGPDIRP